LRELDCEAYHEAGHTVVALHVGLPVEIVTVEISVVDGEEEGAHTRHVATRGLRRLEDAIEAKAVKVQPEQYALVLNNLLVCWGGVVAERLLCRRAPGPFWTRRPDEGSDAAYALAMARMVGVPGGRQARAFVDRFEVEARRILTQRWHEVEAVAKALLKHGTVRGPELPTIIAHARRPRSKGSR
jgi:hypothetical protein